MMLISRAFSFNRWFLKTMGRVVLSCYQSPSVGPNIHGLDSDSATVLLSIRVNELERNRTFPECQYSREVRWHVFVWWQIVDNALL